MNSLQRIDDFINGELQLIADDLKQEIVDGQYEDLQEELYLAELMNQQDWDDCDGPWYWEVK
jgi:hypothetical protein